MFSEALEGISEETILAIFWKINNILRRIYRAFQTGIQAKKFQAKSRKDPDDKLGISSSPCSPFDGQYPPFLSKQTQLNQKHDVQIEKPFLRKFMYNKHSQSKKKKKKMNPHIPKEHNFAPKRLKRRSQSIPVFPKGTPKLSLEALFLPSIPSICECCRQKRQNL